MTKETEFRRAVGYTLGGIGALVALVLVAGLLTTGNAFFQAGIAKVTAAPRVTQQVYQPDNIINQVTFFTQTCEDVTRDYANWKNNEEGYERALHLAQLARTQGEAANDTNEAQQLSAGVQGALAVLQSDAANYNAKSINYTANPFKSRGLPYRIEVPAPLPITWSPPSCG